jgi:hypothetical protein
VGLPCCPYCKYHPVVVTREYRSPTWASFFDEWRAKHNQIYCVFIIYPVMVIAILIKLICLPFKIFHYGFCQLVDRVFHVSWTDQLRDSQVMSNGFRVYCPQCGHVWHMPA